MTGWHQRRLGWAFALNAVVLVSGCGQDSGIETVPVTGLVTLDEKPVAGAVVTYSSGQAIYSGYTDDDGEYSLKYSKSVDGIPPGDYRVTIRTVADLIPGGGPGIAPPGASGGANAAKPKLIPKKFQDFEKSGLEANVALGADNEFNFPLQSE